MMKYLTKLFQLIGLVLLMPALAQAYVGPGAGISAIGTLIALVAAFVVALIGFIWFPLKRLCQKNKSKPTDNEDIDSDTAESAPGREEKPQ
jgi:hypothetical protein